MTRRTHIKRATDLQIISNWIESGASVLDLGCGRGVLLQHLQHKKGAYVVGVDNDLAKVQRCIKRGVNVYQGDAESFMNEIPEQFYEWVILSRTVQELSRPGEIILKALEVGRNVAVGFVNYGFWLNRWQMMVSGSRVTNEVFPLSWESGTPYNPVTIHGFELFCQGKGIDIPSRVYLKGDWQTRMNFLPNLMAGYAVYHLRRG